MSMEGRLGKKKLAKLSALAGFEVTCAWAWHPYVEFRDSADNHYLWNKRTNTIEPMHPVRHYTSCPKSAWAKSMVDTNQLPE